MKSKRIAAAALLGACMSAPAVHTANAADADVLKPGLWEVSSKFGSADAQVDAAMAGIQKHLQSMSPEQRKSMQQMMERNGVQLDVGTGGTLRTRMCMTREMIARREVPVQQGQCTQKVTPVTPTHMKVVFNCTRPRASGDGDIFVESDTRYRARLAFRSEQHTQNQTVNADATGTWVSSDCGNIRPLPAEPAK